MEDQAAPTKLSLTDQELSSIDGYRRKKNTAVLTIMFTDIQGFTALSEEKGESYVHALHESHDRILVEAIEEDDAGVVIKFIGDSVMAVFSEPTAAVEKALRIQERLKKFNLDHPELVDLKVRIGLHMGQTVIENKIRTDLFGRQVNKASRVESLATGGHIYLSYPVFDSVKSWLLDSPETKFVCHGSYFLKGIAKAEEIYEVFQPGVAEPQAPRNAKKQKPFPGIWAGAAAAVILAGAGLFLVTWLAKPEVYFTGMNAREPVVDFTTPLGFTEVPGSPGMTKAVTDLGMGKHILHYEVSSIVRYFAPVDVKPGKNVVPVAFQESYLPNTEARYEWGDTTQPAPAVSAADDEKYFFYDHKTKGRIDHEGVVNAVVTGSKLTQAQASFEVRYTVTIDQKIVADQTFTVDNPLNQTDRLAGPAKVVYEDDYHTYTVRYSCWNRTIQVDVEGAFKG